MRGDSSEPVEVEIKLHSSCVPNSALSAKARILIVEDHPFVREGLVRLVNGQKDLICCCEADSIAAAAVAVVQHKPDLVLLDRNLTDGDAFQLIELWKARSPQLAILILSQCDEPAFVEKALRTGARGYISKDEAVHELFAAIHAVLGGDFYVGRAMSGQLIERWLSQ